MRKKLTKAEIRRQIGFAETYLRTSVKVALEWAEAAQRNQDRLDALKRQLKSL